MRHILIVKAGDTAKSVAEGNGDYDAWFRKAFQKGGVAAGFTVVRPGEGQGLPALGVFDGLVVTGSPKSVTADEPWMMPLAKDVLAAAERGLPVLGVCFGHQLLCAALGGKVAKNPSGREIGTQRMELTEAGRSDPVLRNLAPIFVVNTTHEDAVVEAPAGAVALVKNANSEFQAARLGPRVLTVQFHPELDGPTMIAKLKSVEAELAAGGADVAALLSSARDTPDGVSLLRAWARNG